MRWLLAAAVALVVAQPFVPGVAIAQEGYGAVFVILWLVLLAIWFAVHLRALPAPLRFTAVDAAALLFFALYAVSGVVAAVRASPRPAVNVTWHWLSVGVAFFLFRQLVRGPLARRGMAAVAIAVGTGMAALGLEQVLISLPQTRTLYARYKHNPQELYVQTGHWLPEGSVTRRQFEARLTSAEPTATFALSNSLAGLLVPAIVLATGILAAQFRPAAKDGARTLWIGISGLALVGCLIFTNSRSGLAATAIAGIAAVVLVTRRRVIWSLVAVATAGVVLAAAYLVRPGALTDAVRSLAFRVEYWRATGAMIADFPLFGCGPGQFQDTYTAYKLAAASEEVADPHNFLLEVASTGGVLAAVVFVAALALVAWHVIRRRADTDDDELKTTPHGGASRRTTPIYLGVAAGTLLGLAASWLDRIPLPTPHVLLFGVTAAFTLAILHRWVRGGEMPARLPGVAACGLLLHWIVSGGIGEPALATLFWLLIALELDGVLRPGTAVFDSSPARWIPRGGTRGAALGLLVAGGLVVGAYVTYYRPVLNASAELARADTVALGGRGGTQLQAVEAATEADPWSIEAWRWLASLRFAAWQNAPSAEALMAWQRADRQARLLAPGRHSVWRESAERFAALHDVEETDEALRQSIAHARRAIELYPTHADHYVLYAELLVEAARLQEARQAIATADKLDRAQEAAGHADKMLRPERRAALERLAQRLDIAP